jgi:hypothetical protein
MLPTLGAARSLPSSGYALSTFEHAIAVIRDPSTPAQDRHLAARVIELVGRDLGLDERLLTDLAMAINSVVGEPVVVSVLLGVLRDRCANHHKLASWLGRLARRAYRDGHRASLVPLVRIGVRVPAWRDVLRDSQVHEALARVLDDAHLVTAVNIILEWAEAHEATPGWMRGAVRQRPKLLGACSPEKAWRLHVAVPTVASWRHVATVTPFAEVCRDAFGPAIHDALSTLGDAIEVESDGALRVLLASWMPRLAG